METNLMIVGNLQRRHGTTYLRFKSDQAFVDGILKDAVDEIFTVKLMCDKSNPNSYILHILD